jgi:hypothetical protein
MNLRIYRWHSINLCPLIGGYSVGNIHGITGRAMEFTLFGMVVVLYYRTKKGFLYGKMWSTQVHGPLWSRKRKQWYWVNQDL